jgi:hypothetical protein
VKANADERTAEQSTQAWSYLFGGSGERRSSQKACVPDEANNQGKVDERRSQEAGQYPGFVLVIARVRAPVLRWGEETTGMVGKHLIQ